MKLCLKLMAICLSLLALSNANPVVEKYRDFEMEVLSKVLLQRSKENVVMSPLAIKYAMEMLYCGAYGYTAEEIRLALHITKNKDDLIKHAKMTSDSLNRTILDFTNKLFYNHDIKLSDKYRLHAETPFHSEFESLDFNEVEKSMDIINQWISKRTKRNIRQICSSIDEHTIAEMVSAAYLKGGWARPFCKEFTVKRDFCLDKEKCIKVPTIHAKDLFHYAESSILDAQLLEAPFEQSDLSMIIILPNKKNGLYELEEKLKSFDFDDINDHWKMEQMDVYVPKFKISSSIPLKVALQKLGIYEMFTHSADFSDMLEHGHGHMPISEVQHAAMIEIHESDASDLVLDETKTYIPFYADHPFAFVIRNKHNVLFAGHVVSL
ncbi:serine protease inhibitor 3/4-like precursor [Musca domestica]|uniref:Serine protease inhibitor 13 n=2 Tax=Musca domestica TaxID=7370 RepID=A0A077D1Y7_MUSDO|nr:serine protease inhibitor 3/4-like precursor [Musca domestica]AIL24301.1 serine protease inhibitor 13 [Musca domestica]